MPALINQHAAQFLEPSEARQTQNQVNIIIYQSSLEPLENYSLVFTDVDLSGLMYL